MVKKNGAVLAYNPIDYDVLYNDQYRELSIENVNRAKQKEAENLVQEVADALLAKGVYNGLKPDDVDYVVDVPDKIKRDLAKGLIKLDFSKKGEAFAQIRVNGKFGKKLPIKQVKRHLAL